MSERLVCLRKFLANLFCACTLLGCAAQVYAQAETTLYEFLGGSDGAYPTSLISNGHGGFFGTTEAGSFPAIYGTVFSLTPSQGGWTLNTIYTFPDSGGPYYPMGLVMGNAGNLFGVTESGGMAGDGTVFEVSPDGHGGWTETTLHSFSGQDGRSPTGTLILDSAGNLYGTTSTGGSCTVMTTGCGVAFELSRNSQGNWTETILHQFGISSADGQIPLGGLVMDKAGNLYGTTSIGGLSGCSGTTCGTVFELIPANGKWNEKVLHYFHSDVLSSDGAFPQDSLALDSAGNIYGTAYMGGAHDRGVVFLMTRTQAQQWQLHVIHSFQQFSTGEYVVAGVTLGPGGKIYAATQDGGPAGNPCEQINSVQGCGVVYEFAPKSGGGWTSTILYTFTGVSDGRILNHNLLLDSAGDLFGVAFAGGISTNGGAGTVFQITP